MSEVDWSTAPLDNEHRILAGRVRDRLAHDMNRKPGHFFQFGTVEYWEQIAVETYLTRYSRELTADDLR